MLHHLKTATQKKKHWILRQYQNNVDGRSPKQPPGMVLKLYNKKGISPISAGFLDFFHQQYQNIFGHSSSGT